MDKLLPKLLACLSMGAAIAACSEPDQSAPQTPAEIAAAATAAELDALSSMGPEEHAALKAMIVSSGGTCTRITRVQGNDMDNKVQVDCSLGPGMPSTAAYTIDLATGTSVKRK